LANSKNYTTHTKAAELEKQDCATSAHDEHDDILERPDSMAVNPN
jgi:hypothetical protein